MQIVKSNTVVIFLVLCLNMLKIEPLMECMLVYGNKRALALDQNKFSINLGYKSCSTQMSFG